MDELFAFMKTEAGEYLTSRMQEKGTCRYVRNHFTLNKQIINGVRCGGDVYSEDAAGNPVYDFEWINDVFKRIVRKGMKPVVEMDFMPDPLIGNSGGITQEGFGHRQGNRYCPNDWDKWEAEQEVRKETTAQAISRLRSFYLYLLCPGHRHLTD